MTTAQEERMTGKVAKLVNRLSKDLSLNRNPEITFRKPGNVARVATVRFSYKAAHEDELDLELDDQIDVMEDAEAGWMKGRLRSTGRIGLFPTNFVQIAEIPTAGGNGISKVEDAKKKFFESAGDDSPEAIQRTSMVDVPKGKVSSAVASAETRKAEPENDSETGAVKEVARVLFTYSPNHDDELALKEVGALVTIISKTCADPGWFLGEVDGKRGLIPDNFVEIIRVVATPGENNKIVPPATQPPPSVPIKPAKPAGLSTSGSVGRRVGSTASTGFAAIHTTLADVLNKPPKAFAPKQSSRSEEGSAESRSEERLSHITTSRPRQPNKRPPSGAFNKRRCEDEDVDVQAAETLGLDVNPPPTTSTPSSVSTSQSSVIATSAKPHSPSFVKMEPSESEFVSRSEYNRLVQHFEDFRAEMCLRVAELEAKLASAK